MSAKNELDQYYTNFRYAKHCFDMTMKYVTLNNIKGVFLEPCAGAGAFFHLFPMNNREGYDLAPTEACVGSVGFCDTPTDYLENELEGQYITISNPPFGHAASLAVKFFNHSAKHSNLIAYIVPKTFMKDSVQNKLDLNFHLVFEEESPKNSFVLDGQPYDVPCVFQIWERKDTKRKKKVLRTTSEYFEFTTKDNADLAVRRVGGRAGQLLEGLDHSVSSTYFIKCSGLADCKETFSKVDLSHIRDKTAGVRSVSKNELIESFEKVLTEGC